MFKELEDIIRRNNENPDNEKLEPDEFHKTAQQLMTKQFLFQSHQRSRKAYDLILRFNNYFHNLFESFNHQLVVNENQRYVGIVPKQFYARMKLEETLMLMMLRHVYQEKVNNWEQEDDGSISIALIDFEEAYQQVTGRSLPQKKSDFYDILSVFEERYLIKLTHEEGNPENQLIQIYPSIESICTGNVMEMMAGYINADFQELEDNDDEVVEGEVEES